MTLSLLVLLSLGCGSIGKDKQQDFLKPFASAAPQEAKAFSQEIPSDYTLCIETAKTVAAEGHAVEAVKLYERAESLNPNAPSLDSNLAPLYASLGNHSEAIKRYQRCASQDPNNVELCNNFAWTLMEAERFSEAIAEATRGLTKDEDSQRLHATLAMIHYRQGDHVKALQGFAKAHGPAAAHHNLSLLEIESGNIESAKEHLRIANKSPEQTSQAQILLTALETQTSKN
ncbi:MAG: tetratricopeptide repeat protein [Planctomycetaceae bacterium]|nr:tetratricopeptide repeat protein [Planctomycetaceae bacterium]